MKPRKARMARCAVRSFQRRIAAAFKTALNNAVECNDMGFTTYVVDMSGHINPVSRAWAPLLKWAKRVAK